MSSIDAHNPYEPPLDKRPFLRLETWPLILLAFVSLGLCIYSFSLFVLKGSQTWDDGLQYIETLDGFVYSANHLVMALAFGFAANTFWEHRRLMEKIMEAKWQDPLNAIIPVFNRLWMRLAFTTLALLGFFVFYYAFGYFRWN